MFSLRCSIIGLVLMFSSVLTSLSVSLATEQDGIFSISKPDIETESQDPEVAWTMELVKSGIHCSVEISFEQPEEAPVVSGEWGWEYRVEIDGIVVLQGISSVTQKRIEQTISLETVTDGKHTTTLAVRDFQGKLHTQKREFGLKSAPKISITSPDAKDGVFDPLITFSFLVERGSLAGMAEIYLDERLLKTVNIPADQHNTPINLSELIGSQMYSADLTPGKHLLTIMAYGINGSSTIHALPVTGSLVLPEIKVNYSADNRFKSIEIFFPGSSKQIVGSAEVHYNRSTILAVRTDRTTLSISRSDLIDALEKHNLEIGDTSATMIISTRSANQVENWQELRFK